MGYLKKCGEVSKTGVLHAYKRARLKSGVVGVKVSIMPPSLSLPDEITVTTLEPGVEEVTDEAIKKEMQAVVDGVASVEQEVNVLKRAKEAQASPVKKAPVKKSTKTKAPKESAESKDGSVQEAGVGKKPQKKAPVRKAAAKKESEESGKAAAGEEDA
ncbi:MAG: hypothetical protein HC945_01380 [Nitrosarchaeum sp.]|nr:hypothetical protein [Nitrosarchaeum sp.]